MRYFKRKKTIVPCEIFPPKMGTELEHAFEIAGLIAQLKPAFISVTCGAGAKNKGFIDELAQYIESTGVPSLAHITCVATPSCITCAGVFTVKLSALCCILVVIFLFVLFVFIV